MPFYNNHIYSIFNFFQLLLIEEAKIQDKKCDCAHFCVQNQLTKKQECKCRRGYYLDKDGKTCRGKKTFYLRDKILN
jgi:hypothetical protein